MGIFWLYGSGSTGLYGSGGIGLMRWAEWWLEIGDLAQISDCSGSLDCSRGSASRWGKGSLHVWLRIHRFDEGRRRGGIRMECPLG